MPSRLILGVSYFDFVDEDKKMSAQIFENYRSCMIKNVIFHLYTYL